MTADGTERQNLTRSPANDGSFAWSPLEVEIENGSRRGLEAWS
jgi:hypothetical protein